MKKILIALFAIPFIALILAAAFVLVALNWPTIVVNPTTLGIAARHIAPLGIRIEWKRARTSSVSHGAFDKTFSVAFEDVCASVKPTLEKACFSRIEASARYRFRALIPELVALGPVAAEGGDVRIRPSDEEKEKPEGALPIPEIRLPGLIAKAKLFPVDVHIDSFVVGGDEPEVTASAEAHVAVDGEGRIEAIDASGDLALAGGERFEVTARALSASHFTDGDWELTADASASLEAAGSASLAARLETADGKEISHALTATYAKDAMRADATLEGTVSEERVATVIRGGVRGVSEYTPRLGLTGCTFELTSTSKRKNRGDLKLSCPVEIALKELKLPHDVDPVYRQPRSVFVDISAKADTFFFPDLEQKTTASLAARIRPQENRLVRMHGNLAVNYEGVLARPPNTWKLTSNADVDFTIDRFAELVKVLGGTKWPVPAPLNVLHGSLEFSLEGSMSSADGEAVFPAKLSTKLESEQQRIFIDSDGKLVIALKGAEVGDTSLDLDVMLSDVQLALPKISMAAIPRFVPDGRIELSPKKDAPRKKTETPSAFAYHVTIRTPEDKPVRILSNLTPTYVPIALDLTLAPEDVSGTISLDEFAVKLFSQTATIEFFDLTLRTPTEQSQVVARISIPYVDITILIEVAGTVEEPSITLASRPPMSQGDIISMLLYGEPLDALDSDDASSAANMNAALANNAIALTSFFVLGATPIQSVGYNPDTQMFSARIKLTKKTSLKVGSSSTDKEVGIRQRLGKGFSITTGWEKSSDMSSSSGAASAYIEWSKRY